MTTTTRPLRELIADICEIRAELKRQGASELAIAAGTEDAVRALWPFMREWKYLCPLCDNTGLKLSLETTRVHGETRIWVGRPCSCSRGERFRDRPKAEQDFTAAGKTPRQPTRFGR